MRKPEKTEKTDRSSGDSLGKKTLRKAEKLRKKDLTKNYSGRSLREILERFDLKNYQDPRNISNKKSVNIIRDYLRISCPIEKAPKILNNFFKKNNLNIFISDDYFPIKKNNLKNIRVK